ncbi:competence protein ComEC [Roseibium hamelinense]|uniref:Competence protein ComEC n=1 Tax=Roseibium hamelinense TaxID=150831 RepID=A0A562TJE7_9HYPH|nr:competence protein ComEC [Roseibium hamelinense]
MERQGPSGPAPPDQVKQRSEMPPEKTAAPSGIRSPEAPLQLFLTARRSRFGAAQAPRAGLFKSVTRRILADLGQLWEQNRLLWCVLAFAAGITAYVLLPQEPNTLAVVALSGAVIALTVKQHRRGTLAAWALVLCAILCGVTAMTVRTALVDAPRLTEPVIGSGTGTVARAESTRRGQRWIVDKLSWDNTRRSDLPRRIRLSVPDTSQAGPGDRIRFRARLFPPAGPVRPGGYDFSFRAYFQGLGATGFSFGPPDILDPAQTTLSIRRLIDNGRQEIAAQIRALLPAGDASALVVALLVGDRSGLSEEGEEALRAAGLAHVLAISGLHMALFAGGAFAAVLFLLSFSERAALSLPTHRIAACVALVAAIVYLGLSGASVATQRSFIMIALVFLGILTGRRGLTLRSVALAGLALLVLGPERLFYPGFQMSFAAVLCLVAVYEGWVAKPDKRVHRQPRRGVPLHIASKTGTWIGGLLITSLVAGAATGFIGAYHFGRVAPMGLAGNMLGMPVFSLLVMPAGVLALVLMPFGLASLPLSLMAWALDLLLAIAAWTASLSETAIGFGGEGQVVPPSAMATGVAVAALFSGLLLKGPLKGVALLPAALAAALFVAARPPDITISERGKLLAAYDRHGVLKVNARRSSFGAQAMLEQAGLGEREFAHHKMAADQIRCDDKGCVVHAFAAERGPGLGAAPLAIALPASPSALLADCRFADVIVTDLVAPADCEAALVLDGPKRKLFGAVSIWLEPPRQPAARPDGLTGTSAGLAKVGQFQTKTSESAETRNAAGPKPVIIRVKTARSAPPRPWHR